MMAGQDVLVSAAVKAGEKEQLLVDYCLINDAQSHSSIDYLGEGGAVYDRNKVVVVIDHDTPSGSVAAAHVQRKLINFAKKHDTVYHHGEGVGYQLMLDHYVQPGQIVVGCGNHLSTLGALGALGISVTPEKLAEVMQQGVLEWELPEVVKIELTGSLPEGSSAKDIILAIVRRFSQRELADKLIVFVDRGDLSLNERITICNLAGRTQAAAAVFAATERDKELQNCRSYPLDLSGIQALIAQPDHFGAIDEVAAVTDIKINEVFIGGCSSGRIEDLRAAASIVSGKQVAKGVRLMVAPVTSDVYVQALREGLLDQFIDAGAVIMNQGCSTCWGKSQGIVDGEEVLLSAGSYNCKGCAGAETAKIYLASAATAAASAIAGVIAAAPTGNKEV